MSHMRRKYHRPYRALNTPLKKEPVAPPEEGRPSPAKLPHDYCKRNKGEHTYTIAQVKAYERRDVERDCSITVHQRTIEQYCCTGCQKKKELWLLDGVPDFTL